MRLIAHETSRAIRFFHVVPTKGRVLYGANLIKAFQTRYGFLEGPRTVADFDLNKGITFLHGYFEGRTVIDRFQLYDNGMLAEAKADTEECSAFLDDVAKWAAAEAGFTVQPNLSLGTPYFSQVVVHTVGSLANAFTDMNDFANEIGRFISSYGLVRDPAEISGFYLQTDPGTGYNWQYRFERRAGAKFSEDLYFSSAPLKTGDHLVLLERLENSLQSLAKRA